MVLQYSDRVRQVSLYSDKDYNSDCYRPLNKNHYIFNTNLDVKGRWPVNEVANVMDIIET